LSTREQGMKAEVYARQFLVKQGLVWLMSNYACRMGEIDLVMQSAQGELVFVEVRRRTSTRFGGALESITPSKQKKLIKTASHYLMLHPNQGQQGVRFDVLAIDGSPPCVTWIKQAFEE
jgi:putative endonuclease